MKGGGGMKQITVVAIATAGTLAGVGWGSAPVKGLRHGIAQNGEGTKGLLTLGELRLGSMSRRVHGGAPCSLGLDVGYQRWCCSSSQGTGAEALRDSSGAPHLVSGVWEDTNWRGNGGWRVS
jgi:hypothetical protein